MCGERGDGGCTQSGGQDLPGHRPGHHPLPTGATRHQAGNQVGLHFCLSRFLDFKLTILLLPLSSAGLGIRIRMEPLSFSLLNPDPGEKKKHRKNVRKLVPVMIVVLFCLLN